MNTADDKTTLAAEALQQTASSLLRWMSRPETRQTLRGSDVVDPISPRGWILARLDENDSIRVTDLAAWLSVDKSTITPQVAALEALGYVTRRQDPHDGRAQQIVITTAGRRAHRSTLRKGQRVFADMIAHWSQEDLAALTRVNHLLSAELDSRTPQPRPST